MNMYRNLLKNLSVSRGEYFPGVMMGKHVVKLIRGKFCYCDKPPFDFLEKSQNAIKNL